MDIPYLCIKINVKAFLNLSVDFRTRHSLSAGRQVILLVGVECSPLQSTGAKKSPLTLSQ